jgi:EpsI family protein
MAGEEGTAQTEQGAGIGPGRDWRALLPFALVVVVAGVLAYVVQPPAVEDLPPVRLGHVPGELGQWRHVGDLSLTETEEKYLVPDAVLYRTYVDNSLRPVTVLVVYRRAERREFFHIPEACYPASGLTILDREPVTVGGGGSSFPAIEITAEGARDQFLTLYWFVSGSRVTASASRQQILMWVDRLTRNNEGWAFIRLITPLRSGGEPENEALDEFAALISPQIMKAIRDAAHR